MNIKPIILGLTLLALTSINAQEVKTGEFGKGILNIQDKDSTFAMNFSMRFQLLGLSSWEENQANQLNASIRRSRLKLSGFAYSPKLKYKFEAGFSSRDLSGESEFTHEAPRLILDAFMEWNFYKNLSLWAGQGKLYGNRERIISSANLQLVDRSLLNKKFNIDRDFGIQLKHNFNLSKTIIVREIFSISQGEGRNVSTGNLGGLQYIGGLEILPFGTFTSKGDYTGGDLKRESTPKLAIKASYEFNNNAVKTRSNQGKYMLINGDNDFYQTNISTLFIDGMFKYKGYSFMFEYANRDAENPVAKNSNGTETGDIVETGTALNLQSGYLLPSNWEIAARYTHINMADITMQNDTDMYTVGISKYIAGHKLKIQSDLSYANNHIDANEILARLQMEIHF